MGRFLTSKKLRSVLYNAADGKCQSCGSELGSDWHADHTVPFSVSGRTNVHEMQALCPACNLKKGARMPLDTRKFFTDTRRVVARKLEKGEKSATLLIECGSGKSSLAPALCYDGSLSGWIDSVIWLVPRISLVKQAAKKSFQRTGFVWELLGVKPDDAARFEINELLDGNPRAGIDPSAGCFGYAMTYDTLRNNRELHLSWMRLRKTLVIFDEVQLFNTKSPTSTAIDLVSEVAAFSVYMSGDFDRGNSEVAGVSYELTGGDKKHRVVQLDVDYNIYDAFEDRAIIPPAFEYGQGGVTWKNEDGEAVRCDSIETAPMKYASDIVEAVVDDSYADDLLCRCVDSWRQFRTHGITLSSGQFKPSQPESQLLIVCGSQAQAERVQRLCVDQHAIPSDGVGLIISKEKQSARDAIDDYVSECPNLSVAVTVGMAYIGMDAPFISHLCCLTNYRSPSWLHQMLARMWRRNNKQKWVDQYCVVFCPNDPRFRKATDKIRAAAQLGVRDFEGDGPGSDDVERKSSSHEGNIDFQEHRYEFMEPNWIAAVIDEPPPQEPVISEEDIRTLLRDSGIDGYAVDAMVDAYVAAQFGESVAESPVTDQRTPAERRQALASELESYQKETARLLARQQGKNGKVSGEYFSLVNGKLKSMVGCSRDEIKSDEHLLLDCIARYAPQLRRRILG